MTYLVIMKQHGEGCDYTIGCGMTYRIVEAESIDELMENEIAFPEGEDEPTCSKLRGDNELKEVIVIPYDQAQFIDLKPWKKMVEDKISDDLADMRSAEDLAEFERLRKKLGK